MRPTEFRYGTGVAMQTAGVSMSNLTLWSTLGFIGPPLAVHGHGHGGKVLLWSRQCIRRAYCLARVPGRVYHHGDLVDALDRHSHGHIIGVSSKARAESWIGVAAVYPRSMSSFLGWRDLPSDLQVVHVPLAEVDAVLDQHIGRVLAPSVAVAVARLRA